MSRIVDESGKYSPEQVPTVEPRVIDAADLPQAKADPYAQVDVLDFSTAKAMDQPALMKMAEIASSRQQGAVAFQWKQLATEKVRQDQSDAEAQRMNDMLSKSGYMPPANSQIVDIDRSTPWDNDEAYRELAHEHGELKAKLSGMDATMDGFFELSGKVAVVADKMQVRKGEITDNLAATGAWTQQDEVALAANQSLVKKSARVANMMKGATE